MTNLNNGNHRILIVDDNQAIHEDFRKILDADRGGLDALHATEQALYGMPDAAVSSVRFSLGSAYQGQEGFEQVKQALAQGQPYAVAFIDVRMPPGWDGIETAAQIWAVDPDIQVVICTAYTDYSWSEMTAKLGYSDRLVILKKPFDNVEALQLANALTAKWNLLQAARNRLSDLEKLVQQRTEELRNNYDRLAIISNASNDVIWDWNVLSDEIWWNERFEVLFGCVDDVETGVQGWTNRVHPDELDRVLEGIRSTLAGHEQSWSDEYRFRRHDGTYASVYAHGQVLRDGAGKAMRMVGAMQDISGRKQAEHEHRLLEVQLRHAQKLESIGQLAAGVAHEINTPMQFIGDNTRFVRDAFGDLQKVLLTGDRLLEGARNGTITPQLIEAAEAARRSADLDYLSQEVPKAIDQTIDGVERVTRIVGAMKEFSHPGTENKVMLDINKAIESTLVVCRHEWKYIADLVTSLDPHLPLVPVLPGEFNQVVLNIVINAAHAIADVVGAGGTNRGTIDVSTRQRGSAVEVLIRDSGAGIPEKIRERIFDPFFTTKSVGKGSGQGLAIARSVIVDKHGGTLTFESEMGKGTCFVIRLPVTDSATGEYPAAI